MSTGAAASSAALAAGADGRWAMRAGLAISVRRRKEGVVEDWNEGSLEPKRGTVEGIESCLSLEAKVAKASNYFELAG